MRLRVDVIDHSKVVVHFTPHWLERLLFGLEPLDAVALYVGGTGRWIWDAPGRRIRNRSIVDEIDQAVRQWAEDRARAETYR